MLNGKRLYLLGGNGSTAKWWEECLPHFTKYQALPLELPGFGENRSPRHKSLDELADALLEMTEPGHCIFAVGINALVVLQALVRAPRHFERAILLAPVGAFLGERRFVRIMAWKPIRKLIHVLLSHAPRLFKRKFTNKTWSSEQYRKIAAGYRQCRAFQDYFDFVRPDNALDLLEWVTDRVDIVWGQADGILGLGQAAAWDSILPRAELTFTRHPDWGHYPYLDDPAEFARYIESFDGGFPAHTKAGRLQLAEWAGLPVPRPIPIRDLRQLEDAWPQLRANGLFAVRSSGANEDHIDHSMAGRHTTFLRVPKSGVREKVQELLERHGLECVVIQEFIEPRVSGVAFCRWMSLEIEYVSGHLEQLVSGEVLPHRAILTKMPGDWALPPTPLADQPGFNFHELELFLRRCLRTFHYHPSDIEWAWDGGQFYMLQLRPVTAYAWRRSLTSANLDELLPRSVSRIMEHGQRQAALSISRIYALWDRRVLHDHEPFTAVFAEASYINADLFLSRLFDWGLPSRLLSGEIGGTAPHVPFSLGRFLRSLPVLLRMYWIVRRHLPAAETGLFAFERELAQTVQRHPQPGPERDASLATWFSRYYLFIVRQNMIINACLSTCVGSFLGKAHTAHRQTMPAASPHRLPFESDPASPRRDDPGLTLDPLPWNGLTRLLSRCGLPGLTGKYFDVREWFRDNNMKLFLRLHHALRGSVWLDPHPGTRAQSGTFWQSGGLVSAQANGFTIHPGAITGVVGQEILVVDALEPGHYDRYRTAQAVIARTGGRLSHGATLLRELGKPSAVIPAFPRDLVGKTITLRDGEFEVKS